VICTAYSDYTWEEMFEKTGTSDRMFILKKPFERMEVLQLAHTLGERRRQIQRARARLQRAAKAGEGDTSELRKVSETFQTEIIRMKKEGGGK
jgi:hypothetical protein